MPDEKLPPLTDEQIREALNLKTEAFINLAFHFSSIERALVNKNLLTESDIQEAQHQVRTEGIHQAAKLTDAIRKGPVGGVQ